MVRDWCPCAVKVEPAIGETCVEIQISAQKETMGVFDIVLDLILFPLTAAVVQVALKNVTAFHIDEIDRCRCGRRRLRYDNLLGRTGSQQSCKQRQNDD